MADIKTVLITGAARRVGRAMALDLAEHGWTVIVHFNSAETDAEEVVSAIRGAGGAAFPVQGDLSQESETHRVFADSRAAAGPITCLINNASVFEPDDIDSADRGSWDQHLETNLRAPFVLSQTLAANLPDGSGGAIINMLDQRVWNLTPNFLSYTVAKTGLWTLTRTLALAQAPRIRVNGIGPGPTLPSVRQTDAQFRQQWQSMPLQRATTLEEICDAVRFILSAPSMTGQMLALDGGQHLGWAQPPEGGIHEG